MSSKRNGSIVFADTHYNYGAVDTELIIPHYVHDDKKWTIGGNMCSPLKALVISGVRHDLSDFPKLKPYGPVVCFDTGSEGYFIIDDTGGKNGNTEHPSVSELIGGSARVMGDGSGNYEIILAASEGQNEFSVRLPEVWRNFPHQPGFVNAIRRPPFRPRDPLGPGGAVGVRSQMLIVGNLWLQAISMTFVPQLGRIFFAHLDAKGRRSPTYLGPVDAPESSSSFVRTAALVEERPQGGNALPPFWHDSGYLGTSLTEQAFQPAGLVPQQEARTDVSVPIKFMVDPGSGSGIPQSSEGSPTVEAPSADFVSQPCLEVSIPLPGGGTKTVTQVADTGSGVNLILSTPGSTDPNDDCEDCGCVGSLTGQPQSLNDLFRTYSPEAGVPRRCQNPSRDAGCGAGCCTQCCLGKTDVDGKPLTSDTQIRCAVSYCTGMVQYKPAFVKASFPGSLEGLDNIEILAGRAAAVCEPAVKDGVWGCWFWVNKEKTKEKGGDVLKDSFTLPFYVLRSLGQEGGGELNNMTWNFWRSDLGLCKEITSAPAPPPSAHVPSVPAPSAPVSSTPLPSTPTPPTPTLPTPTPPAPTPPAPTPPIANPFSTEAMSPVESFQPSVAKKSIWSIVGVSAVVSLGIIVVLTLISLFVLNLIRTVRS